ncbi:MAG: diacylglycerol kinase family protein [Anaerolineae bacterium]
MNRPYKGNLLQSFQNAFAGLALVIREERNARIHIVTAVLVIAVSAWLQISPIEWTLMIAAIALVFAGEMLNTVVELTVDLITVERNPLAKQAKDVAAGAILVAAAAAVVMGGLILGPHLWEKLAALPW